MLPDIRNKISGIASSSLETERLLKSKGFDVQPLSDFGNMDLYIDGGGRYLVGGCLIPVLGGADFSFRCSSAIRDMFANEVNYITLNVASLRWSLNPGLYFAINVGAYGLFCKGADRCVGPMLIRIGIVLLTSFLRGAFFKAPQTIPVNVCFRSLGSIRHIELQFVEHAKGNFMNIRNSI